MTRKNFILFFIAIIIMLPIFFSFATALSSNKAEEGNYMVTPMSCPEEESKEDTNSFEEEKNFSHITHTISPIAPFLKIRTYLFSQSKPITGISLLPYNPPELS